MYLQSIMLSERSPSQNVAYYTFHSYNILTLVNLRNEQINGCQRLGMGVGVGGSGAIRSLWDPYDDRTVLYLDCGVDT